MSVRKTLNVGKKLVTSVLKNTLTKYELSNKTMIQIKKYSTL